jgi:hypothetical protein
MTSGGSLVVSKGVMSSSVLLEYGCVHYPLDCDLWLHGSRVREFWGEALE